MNNAEISKVIVDTFEAARQVAAERDALRLENERLRKIVDALPKTADGVAIVPGMTIYRNFVGQVHEFPNITGFIDDGIDNDYQFGTLYFRDGFSREQSSKIYSTRDAAKAALAERSTHEK